VGVVVGLQKVGRLPVAAEMLMLEGVRVALELKVDVVLEVGGC
jgi:hypothetical protein